MQTGSIYTIVVNNNSNTDVNGAIVKDALPTGYNPSSITCSSTSTSICPSSNDLTIANMISGMTIPTMAANSSMTFVINGIVTISAQLINKATINLPTGYTDPNPNNNVSEFPTVFDPPSGKKVGTYLGKDVVEWKQVWINEFGGSSVKATISDDIPAGTTYVPGSLQCFARGLSFTTSCTFDSTKNTTTWIGTIGTDLGKNTEDTASNEVVVTFQIVMPKSMNEVSNQSKIVTDNDRTRMSDNPNTDKPLDSTIVTRPVVIIPQSEIEPTQTAINTIRTGGSSQINSFAGIVLILMGLLTLSTLLGKKEYH